MEKNLEETEKNKQNKIQYFEDQIENIKERDTITEKKIKNKMEDYNYNEYEYLA